MRTQSGLGVAVLCACALLAACGGGSDGASADESGTSTSTPVDPPTSASSTTEATTSTTIDDEEAAILAAVDGYWESYLAANRPPDPQNEDLARYRTGDVLELAMDNARERRDLGQEVRVPRSNPMWSHNVESVAVSQSQATVVDCAVDDSQLVDTASGVILDDSIMTFRWSLDLENVEGRWLVAHTTITDEWDGVAGCAA